MKNQSYATNKTEAYIEFKAKISRVKRKEQLNKRYEAIMINFNKVSYDTIEDLNIFKEYVLLNANLGCQTLYIEGSSKTGRHSISVKPVISDILKKLVKKYRFEVPAEDKKNLNQLRQESKNNLKK